MADTTKSTSKYWIYFGISLVIMVAMMIWVNSWFWVALPFVLTYLVQALDVM